MLLSITTTHRPATDLGYLLGKHPDRCQEFPLAHGAAHVFYPQADADSCTACLLLDVDPIGLVRGRPRGDGTLALYVNDRPYVASSFLSVAIARVLGSALSGTCRERPELARTAIPLEARVSTVPCRGGEGLVRRLFEPLDYRVEVGRAPLDPRFPEWGDSPYHHLQLAATTTVAQLLTHLYVLLPVLDDHKHYWVGRDEIDKLLARGGDWLPQHPERETIARRYLKRRESLAREAIERLRGDEEPDPAGADDASERQEQALEKKLTLNEQRLAAVIGELHALGARRVLDLGCGDGKLLLHLVRDRSFEAIVGVDVSLRALESAAARLRVDRMSERQRARLRLLQGSLTYRDGRYADCDAACVVEVIEHIDPSRLPAFERVLFEHARPPAVIVTTPNVEYNARFENLAPGKLRHRDHRFEWTRAEFEAWATRVAEAHGYAVRLAPIGPVDPEVGAPTQMGVFTR